MAWRTLQLQPKDEHFAIQLDFHWNGHWVQRKALESGKRLEVHLLPGLLEHL